MVESLTCCKSENLWFPIFLHIFHLINEDALRKNTLSISDKTQALTKSMNMNIWLLEEIYMRFLY